MVFFSLYDRNLCLSSDGSARPSDSEVNKKIICVIFKKLVKNGQFNTYQLQSDTLLVINKHLFITISFTAIHMYIHFGSILQILSFIFYSSSHFIYFYFLICFSYCFLCFFIYRHTSYIISHNFE